MTDIIDWEKMLEEEGLGDIDKKLNFTTDTKNRSKKIIDLEIKEDFSASEFILSDNGVNIGAINYSMGDIIHINFLATVNGNIENLNSDDEFKQYYNNYLEDNNNFYSINGLGKELLLRFISKFSKTSQIDLVSLEESKEFYIKVLKEFENEGLIDLSYSGLNFSITIL